jgi:hypothetical protein
MLIIPWRKHLAFACGSILSSGDLHDIRHAEQAQLAIAISRSRSAIAASHSAMGFKGNARSANQCHHREANQPVGPRAEHSTSQVICQRQTCT